MKEYLMSSSSKMEINQAYFYVFFLELASLHVFKLFLELGVVKKQYDCPWFLES